MEILPFLGWLFLCGVVWPCTVGCLAASLGSAGVTCSCDSQKCLLLLVFSHLAVSHSLPHGLQHARLPCPSLSPRVCSDSCPLSQWCHPTISSSATPFSSCPQSLSASGSFSASRLFISDGQSTGASASVLSMRMQGQFPLGLTGLEMSIYLVKNTLRVKKSVVVENHQ